MARSILPSGLVALPSRPAVALAVSDASTDMRFFLQGDGNVRTAATVLPACRIASGLLYPETEVTTRRGIPRNRMALTRSAAWRLAVLNLFASRAAHPAYLKRATDPRGPDNKASFDKMFSSNGPVNLRSAGGVQGRGRVTTLTAQIRARPPARRVRFGRIRGIPSWQTGRPIHS